MNCRRPQHRAAGRVNLIIAGLTAVAALLSAYAGLQSAKAADNSATAAEKTLELQQQVHNAIVDTIEPAFEIVSGDLQVCTPAGSAMMNTVKISPIFEYAGTVETGRVEDYGLSRLHVEDASTDCFEIQAIRKTMCNHLYSNRHEMARCEENLKDVRIEYEVRGSKKTTYKDVR